MTSRTAKSEIIDGATYVRFLRAVPLKDLERAKKVLKTVMCLGCIAFQSVYDKRDQMVSTQIRDTRLQR